MILLLYEIVFRLPDEPVHIISCISNGSIAPFVIALQRCLYLP